MRTWAILLLLVGGIPADKPDFSGTWVLIEPHDPPDYIARSLVVRQVPRLLTSGSSRPTPFITLTIDRTTSAGAERHTYDVGVTGGIVGGIPAPGTGEQRTTTFSITWEGNVLLIQNGSYAGEGESRRYTEDEERWSLKRQRLVIQHTHRSSTTPQRITSAVYRRG